MLISTNMGVLHTVPLTAYTNWAIFVLCRSFIEVKQKLYSLHNNATIQTANFTL